MRTQRMRFVFVIGAVLALLACGCSVRQEGTQNAKYYGNDGLKGLSNTNPNMPTSPTYHTYERDVQMMENVLKDIRGIQDIHVFIQGADAHVGLKLDPSLNNAKRKAVEKQAFSRLSEAMPRYRIHVATGPNQAPLMQKPFWGTGNPKRGQ